VILVNERFDLVILVNTGVARNFDWEGPKLKKNCDVILMTFFGDVMVMASLKWRHPVLGSRSRMIWPEPFC